MISRDKLQAELQDKREDFRSHAKEQAAAAAFYLEVLARLEKTPTADIERQFVGVDVGAIPADELDTSGSFRVPFNAKWENHEQARTWADEALALRTTFAADGSQIYVEKETSLPIGAIQVGWFENPHNAAVSYVKDSTFRVLTPADLLANQDEPFNPETRVGEERFHAEVAAIATFLEAKRGWQERGERMPLAFFDGTLLVSFSLPQTKLQTSFLKAMAGLVKLSAETAVPMVGYVDRSFSRDVTTLLDNFADEQTFAKTLFDTALLGKVLKRWGDRTCFCYSRRHGLEVFNDEASGLSSVGFCYLQTTNNSAARLDIPTWVYQQGLLAELIDVVRGECVIGLGYPYPLEAADQTAVISIADREVFFRALQEFAGREKLDFSVNRKQASKNRRR